MEKKFASVASYFRSLSYSKKLTVLSALVLVIALPAILLAVSKQENISSNADTTTIVEAESGTLSGNVVVKTSDQASGGKYIQFDVISVTPQPPTPTTYQPPTPRPTAWPPTPLPHPTCTPRPACLSAIPQCSIAQPIGGWCPVPTPTTHPFPTLPISTPRPTIKPLPTPTPSQLHGNGNGNQ